jgi:hypothetical protein
MDGRNRITSGFGTYRHLLRRNAMTGVGGQPEVTGAQPKRRDCPPSVCALTQLAQLGGSFCDFARGGVSLITGLGGAKQRFERVVPTLGIDA